MRAALVEAGLDTNLRYLDESTRTAADAAQALGCELGAIVKSLVFMADDHAVLVLVSGQHRVDTSYLAEQMGWQDVRPARPEEVTDATGQPIGGVAPVGHPNRLITLIDATLAAFGAIWSAAGEDSAVFSATFEQLIDLCQTQEVSVQPR